LIIFAHQPPRLSMVAERLAYIRDFFTTGVHEVFLQS